MQMHTSEITGIPDFQKLGTGRPAGSRISPHRPLPPPELDGHRGAGLLTVDEAPGGVDFSGTWSPAVG